MNHIVIISYPRSGTHLLIDLIRNNFSDFHYPYISFRGIKNRNIIKDQLVLINRISKSYRIFKTHDFPNALFSKTYQSNLIIKYILLNSYFIFVSRDGKDVLVSEYYRKINDNENYKNLSFTSFIKSKTEFQNIQGTPAFLWSLFQEEWQSQNFIDITKIDYSEMVENPEDAILKISCLIKRKPITGFRDVRLSSVNTSNIPLRYNNGHVKPNEIARTSIYFRKGIVGDYINYFTEEDLNFYAQEVNNAKVTFK